MAWENIHGNFTLQINVGVIFQSLETLVHVFDKETILFACVSIFIT